MLLSDLLLLLQISPAQSHQQRRGGKRKIRNRMLLIEGKLTAPGFVSSEIVLLGGGGARCCRTFPRFSPSLKRDQRNNFGIKLLADGGVSSLA